MGIQFTADQVLKMAPDASSASAGKKLANAKNWKDLGQSDTALWGSCQGSALYLVRVDLSSLTIQCNCPSRKHPCKHGLGLLLLTINSPATVPIIAVPDAVQEWLDKRAESARKKEERQATASTKAPGVTQQKTLEKRQEQVRRGIEKLDLWLNDLVRNGLGTLETTSSRFWDTQAAEMVDAQAPGLASRLKNMGGLVNASPDWTAKLLGEMGKLALLSEAYQRLEQQDPALQEDIRQLIGWSVKETEVLAQGERVTDEWLVLGQTVEELERGRSQRTWLYGINTRRQALLIQFAFFNETFKEIYPLGGKMTGELVYWPGKLSQRALLNTKTYTSSPIQEALPGHTAVAETFTEIAAILAQNPWRERFLCLLQQVTPTYIAANNYWAIQDQAGHELPLAKTEHWKLLAISGGLPVDFAGEWNGETLTPLGIYTNDKYYLL